MPDHQHGPDCPTCPACNGWGYYGFDESTCDSCQGMGRMYSACNDWHSEPSEEQPLMRPLVLKSHFPGRLYRKVDPFQICQPFYPQVMPTDYLEYHTYFLGRFMGCDLYWQTDTGLADPPANEGAGIVVVITGDAPGNEHRLSLHVHYHEKGRSLGLYDRQRTKEFQPTSPFLKDRHPVSFAIDEAIDRINHYVLEE